jgi:hypothetical protein
MLGYKGPAQPSPALENALNAGYLYLEVRCLGCDTHQMVALNIGRRPKATPIHEFEDIRTSAAILLRFGPLRFRPMILRRHGGRGSDKRANDGKERHGCLGPY